MWLSRNRSWIFEHTMNRSGDRKKLRKSVPSPRKMLRMVFDGHAVVDEIWAFSVDDLDGDELSSLFGV